MWNRSLLWLAAIWQLIRNPGLVDAGEQVILLFVLESSKYPSCLRPEEVALFVGLDGKYPSTCHVILRTELPQINEVKNLVVNQQFPLELFRSSKLLNVSSYLLG